MTISRMSFARLPLLALFLLGLACAAGPASATEPVYPKGSRIGLVPPDGVVPMKGAMGFENPANNLIVSFRELPPAAFESIDSAVRDGKPMPAAMEKAESFTTAAGKAYLSRAGGPNSGPDSSRVAIIVSDGKISGYVAVDIPKEAAKAYPDPVIRKMLASTTFRAEVPAEEQLDLMPFKVSDMSDFKTVRTLVPGAAVMLTDSDEEAVLAGAPYVLVAVIRGSADHPDARDRFARSLLSTVPGIRDGRVVSSEPMRIGGTAGYETRMEGFSVKENKPINVVQWLRFGGGATLRIIAGSTREEWPEAFGRFRAVRDGIDKR
jgi:ABC-type sugar transport system substrate-binding protein